MRRSILAGTAVGTLLVGLVGLALWYLRLDAAADARLALTKSGEAIVHETASTLQPFDAWLRVEQAHFAAATAWREPPSVFDARLRRSLPTLPGVAAALIANAKGVATYAVGADSAGDGVADRPFFLAQRKTGGNRIYVGRPVDDEVSGERIFWLSRRIMSRDGRFLGIAAIAVRSELLLDLYRSLTGESTDRIALYREDGPLLVRYARRDAVEIGGPSAVYAVRTAAAGALPTGPKAGSAGRRLSYVHSVDRFPLLLQASISERAALAAWRRTAWIVGGATAFAAAALALLTAAMSRRSLMDSGRGAAFRAQETMPPDVQRLRHMGSWTYDMVARKVDCTEAVRRALNLDSATAVRRAAIVKRIHRADRKALLRAVLAAGNGADGELELRLGTEPPHGRWVHVRAVPQPGTAAVSGWLREITERKFAEASRAQLAAIVETSEDAIVTIATDGTVLAWNRAAERLFGYAPQEAIGKNLGALLPADQAAETNSLLQAITAGRRIERHNTARRGKSGETVHVALSASPIPDAHGRITTATVIARDVTAAKQSEVRHSLEHAVMRALLEAGSTDGAVVRVVRTLCQALGWDFGARWHGEGAQHELVLAETWCRPALASCGLEAAVRRGEKIFPRLAQRAFAAGSTVWQQELMRDPDCVAEPALREAGISTVLMIPVKTGAGILGVLQFFSREPREPEAGLLETAGMIGTQLGQYIERQRAVEDRFAADARLQRIMANIPDAVFQFKRAPDGSFSFPFVSERVFDLYGERAEDVMRDYTLVFAPVRPGHQRHLAKSMLRSKRTGLPWTFETLIRCKNGARRWIRGQASVSYLPDGSVCWDGVLSDITLQKRAALEVMSSNERLEKRVAERTRQLEAINQELEAFSYSVSHDLRVPLRAMQGYSRLLQDQYGTRLDESGQHYLERMGQATRRMTELVDDLLQLARVSRSELKRETVDLSRIAREVLQTLTQDAPHRCVTARIEDNVLVNGDGRLLRIVLENLLGNAWKFTQCTPAANIEFGRRNWNGAEAIYVRDNGAGFDMKRAHKLFSAFQRLHRAAEFEGNGIGLATVRRVVTLHGGKVWAEGAVNQGATFYFALPRS